MRDDIRSDAPQEKNSNAEDFVRQAEQGGQHGAIREFWNLLRHTRKWWLTPIIVSLLILSAIVVLGGTPLAPFIYTLF